VAGFDYSAKEFHVSLRKGLAPAILKPLDPFLEDFNRNKLFGEARFWTHIHRELLGGSAALPAYCMQMLEAPKGFDAQSSGQKLAAIASQLVSHAHGHHHIEDEHFFPVFLQRFPSLADPIDLLENDHGILGETLDTMERAIANLTATVRGEKVQHSELMRATEALHAAASDLDRLFVRHIGDEEEICLPVLMHLQDQT